MSKAGASLATCYGLRRHHVMTKAENIPPYAFICGCGVLSDGLIYMGNNGEELKAFSTFVTALRYSLCFDLQYQRRGCHYYRTKG